MKTETFQIPEIPNRYILHNANIYYESAQIIANNNTEIGRYSPVIITTLCFSIEMYLKSLNAVLVLDFGNQNTNEFKIIEEYSTVPKHDHDLIDLYDILKNDIKTILQFEYAKTRLSSEYKTIDDIIRKYSKQYVTCRYIFERNGSNKTIDLTNLQCLSDFFFATLNNWKTLNSGKA